MENLFLTVMVEREQERKLFSAIVQKNVPPDIYQKILTEYRRLVHRRRREARGISTCTETVISAEGANAQGTGTYHQAGV